VIHVTRFGATVRVHRDGLTDIMTVANASRLLAGLEVALAAALREAGRGKCLKCGHEWETAIWVQPWDVCHCDYCGGVLAPVAEGRGEGCK
jgi:Zn finger protein HypA/HybF involved in hydrogenase expression